MDPERAPHLRWAYEAYATGEWSIGTLAAELEDRGLKSRPTRRYVGTPLNTTQVHRVLTNPYYKGIVTHRGAQFAGIHPALVDDELWDRVQEILAGRRIAGDRSWRHTTHLKGTLRCNRCGGRMDFGPSRGRGGSYDYYFCLNRHTGRKHCTLPYLPAEQVEDASNVSGTA